jgi:aspartate carbamoyltransferase catalytic subunit
MATSSCWTTTTTQQMTMMTRRTATTVPTETTQNHYPACEPLLAGGDGIEAHQSFTILDQIDFFMDGT